MLRQPVDDEHDALGVGALRRQRAVDHDLGAVGDDDVRLPIDQRLLQSADRLPVGEQFQPVPIRREYVVLDAEFIQRAHVGATELRRHDEDAVVAGYDFAEQHVA